MCRPLGPVNLERLSEEEFCWIFKKGLPVKDVLKYSTVLFYNFKYKPLIKCPNVWVYQNLNKNIVSCISNAKYKFTNMSAH